MKILIEVEVKIDGPITATERRELIKHLREGIEPELEYLRLRLAPGARMLGTICRFSFGKVEAKVE